MPLHALYANLLLTPFEEIPAGVVLIENESILAVGARSDISIPETARKTELGEHIITPGFIDMMEASDDGILAIAKHLLKHGTTSFLPTTVSSPLEDLEQCLAGLSRVLSRQRESQSVPAAEPLGVHLEGPFISVDCRGAHPVHALLIPSIESFKRLHTAAEGWLKIMTMAPELPGSEQVQSYAQHMGVKIGIGHSNATYEQAAKAISAGATHGVHLYNAMRPFGHREPGILGALLTDDRAMAEIITDGVHVAPAAVDLLVRAKSASRTILVTDALSATGMKPGQYKLGAMDITVQPEPSGTLACRNLEGTLAGSVLTQDRAVRNVINFTGVTLKDAVRMATANPAQLLGIGERKGRLAYGADADLAILTRDGRVAGMVAKGRLETY
jgi:N-acetylglucosamine-6-phosphate deacetylase